MPKQAEVKRDGVINHKISISVNVNTENFDALKTVRIKPKSTVELQDQGH